MAAPKSPESPESPGSPGSAAGDEHQERVHGAFDDLESKLGNRAAGDAKQALDQVRAAAARKDAGAARESLSAVREQHGWLWEEMTRHPRVAALIDELALWGF